ncbi:hypothetical protein PINS_up013311 [Pythium insidiosum]|nr:hypothetical protein PINS_up013311 [Pythium insidiosum]
MTKLRARRQHVDYTDLLSPAAKAPASAVGRKKAGGRKPEAADAGDAEDAEEEDMTKHAKGKPAKPRKKVAARDTTVVSTNANEDEADVPPRKTAKNKKKKKSAYDDDDEEAVARQQDDEPQRKRVKTSTVAAAAEPAVSRSQSQDDGSANREPTGTKAASRSGSDADELTTLRKKYEALKKFRETETERILKDAKALALEEKKTYEKLIAKLKHEVSRLSSRADDASARYSKQIDKLQAEHQQRLESLEKERDDARTKNERLRHQLQQLDGSKHDRSTRSNGLALSENATAAVRAADTIELAQAKKLLDIYRLVTSVDIRLIESLEDDEDEIDASVIDVACRAIDAVSGKQFLFDLAIPQGGDEEIEYAPSDKAPEFKVPAFLQEELSFKRAELTKFMRTILDVVIRKKKSNSESAK